MLSCSSILESDTITAFCFFIILKSLFEKDPFKSTPKVLVENGVNDWIES